MPRLPSVLPAEGPQDEPALVSRLPSSPPQADPQGKAALVSADAD